MARALSAGAGAGGLLRGGGPGAGGLLSGGTGGGLLPGDAAPPSAFSRVPPPHPSALLGESLQEIMARLLFSIVHWVRHLPSFRALPSRDQVSACRLIWIYEGLC